MNTRSIVMVLGLICAAGALAGERSLWAPNGEEEFVGRAMERETGKPLPGVWVLAVYILSAGGMHEQAHCSVAEFVRSNDRGEYVLPYYEGLPPQFLHALGRRYKQVYSPRTVYKDERLRWIVNIAKFTDGKGQIVGREGPFASEQEALKASRKLQDVYLEKFKGTDDEWVRQVLGVSAQPGCPSRKTSGMVGWDAARLAEAEAVPDSGAKQEVVRKLQFGVEFEKSRNPEGARRFEKERGQ